MTLREWLDQHNERGSTWVDARGNSCPIVSDNGAAKSGPARVALWHLSDYRVIEVSAGSIWLAPR